MIKSSYSPRRLGLKWSSSGGNQYQSNIYEYIIYINILKKYVNCVKFPLLLTAPQDGQLRPKYFKIIYVNYVEFSLVLAVLKHGQLRLKHDY
jgi:hypothetical protein